MTGGFGEPVRRFTARLFADGLVHGVASDAHDGHRRPPGLADGFEQLDAELPGLAQQAPWFTVEAPRAVLAGEEPSAAPKAPSGAPRGLRRLLGRR